MTHRITLAVLAYRQETFIDAAVHSALSQACEPIEILLSDDASPDGTFARMQALASAYQGPHKVMARRNATNLGMGRHFNEVMQAASGQLVVIMAGDDLSLPERVAQTATAWDATGQRADLIASHVIDMSHDGRDLGVLQVDDLAQWRGVEDWARHRPYIVGAAHAVTRRSFERFGALSPQLVHEDQANVLRALCAGGACTVDAALVRYRRGGVSGRMSALSGEQLMARMRAQTARHLALHEQWLRDARTCGCEPLVEQAIRHEYQRELYLQALGEARGARARWQAVVGHPHVKLGWRLRKLAYFGMPTLSARMRAMKEALSRPR